MSRVLVIGVGSIGSRRARILAQMGHEVCVYDTDIPRMGAVARAAGPTATVAPMFGTARWAEAVFLCTPADTHVRIAFDCLQLATVPRGLFIEKPLSTSMDGVAELCDVAEALGVVTMGACNMRWAYGSPPQASQSVQVYIEGALSGWGANAARYRPTGIILEAAIHGMDTCAWLAGPITEVDVRGDNDAVTVLLRHGALDGLVWADWREGSLQRRQLHVDGARYDAVTSDAMYREEMAHFLEAVAANRPTCNPLRSAAHVLEWALVAKEQTMGARV